MKKIFALLLVISISAVTFFTINTASASADTCTWVGTTGAFNDAANWTGCDNTHTPEAGDDLVFPSNATTKSVVIDDMPIVNDITITGDYNFSTTNATVFTMDGASASLHIDGDVTFASAVSFLPTGTNFFATATDGDVVTFNGAVAADANGELDFGSDAPTSQVNWDFVGAISGTTTQFVVVDGAVMNVRNATNTITATTIGAEENSVFICRSATCFGNAANQIYAGGGALELRASATLTNPIVTSASTPDDSIIRAYSNISMQGTVSVSDDLFIAQYGTGANSLQFQGAVTINGARKIETSGLNSTDSQIRFDSGISGGTATGVTADHVRLLLNSANTFTGDVTAKSESNIVLANTGSLGASTNKGIVQDTGQITTALTSTGTIANDFQIIGSGNTGSAKGALTNSSNTIQTTFSGGIVLTGIAQIGDSGTCSSNHFTIFSGVISGNFALYTRASANACVVFLSGSSPNTFTGALTHKNGFLTLSKNGAAPHDVVLDPNGSTAVQTAVTTDAGLVNPIGGKATGVNITSDDQYFNFLDDQTVSELAMDGPGFALVCQGNELIVDQDTNSTFGGTFGNGGDCSVSVAQRIITKQGTGTLTIVGDDANDDDTTFNVEDGILAINSDRSQSNVIVNGGTLHGDGSIDILVGADGSFSPGNSPGCMDMEGFTAQDGFVFTVDIDGGTPCSGYDQISVDGPMELLTPTLDLNLNTNPPVGTVFTIIQSNVLTGTFDGLANNAVFEDNGVKFRINYTSENVTLTVQPADTPVTATTGVTGALPATGFDLTNLVWGMGASLLVFGAFLAMTSRKRRLIKY